MTDQLYNPSAIQHNMILINNARAGFAAIAGFVAGILGLTGVTGFLLYLTSSILMSYLIFRQTGYRPSKYVINSSQILYNGIFSELTTFILFWTFIYGMVHVY